jgi:hypothetical protein
MDLREALTQIAEIRQQVAQTETFRGYRALPVALSGALAWAGAGLQAWLVPEPAHQIDRYLGLWLSAALASLIITGAVMLWHARVASSPLARSLTMLAVTQFLPALVAGGLLTAVLVRFAPENLWMLPGLWSILFSLGVFASHRLLPGATFWIGAWYLGSGLLCLALAQGAHAFSPWAMAVPFGVGQLLAAAVLYWSLERNHEQI